LIDKVKNSKSSVFLVKDMSTIFKNYGYWENDLPKMISNLYFEENRMFHLYIVFLLEKGDCTKLKFAHRNYLLIEKFYSRLAFENRRNYRKLLKPSPHPLEFATFYLKFKKGKNFENICIIDDEYIVVNEEKVITNKSKEFVVIRNSFVNKMKYLDLSSKESFENYYNDKIIPTDKFVKSNVDEIGEIYLFPIYVKFDGSIKIMSFPQKNL